MERNEKFEYTYSAPTEEERKEIDSIRKAYQPQEEKKSKLERLRALDLKVRRMPMAAGLSVGTVGILTAGLGMTMVIEWSVFVWGVLVGVVGIAVAAVAYPVYKGLLNRNKRKYGQEILALSDELLNNRG